MIEQNGKTQFFLPLKGIYRVWQHANALRKSFFLILAPTQVIQLCAFLDKPTQLSSIMTKSKLDAIEASNKLITSDATKTLKENNTGVKAVLVASNDPCWLITNSPVTRKNSNKWCVHLMKHLHPCSLTSKKINSRGCLSKTCAETDMFLFRHGKENPYGKSSVGNAVASLIKSDSLPLIITAKDGSMPLLSTNSTYRPS